MSAVVDWRFAASAGARLVAPGPILTPAAAAAEVAHIRRAALTAQAPVAQTARLHTPQQAPPAIVVDRATWIGANAESMGGLLEPALASIVAARAEALHPAVTRAGARATGLEVGAMLAFLAGKVLGQYDLAPQGEPRLLLVAPNIVQTATQLDVDPADFRLWVCLHEETHRVQFTAVPWLRHHLIDRSRALATSLTPDQQALAGLARHLVQRLPEVLGDGGPGLVDLFTTSEQRDAIAELTAVMSLLEGHADVVMDDVGPAHVPSVALIRRRFTVRRQGAGLADRMLRRLLGLDAKMRQYADGARFVRSVQSVVGVDGFNAVWSSPQTLPRPDEIVEPQRWVARVHG